ncbi:M48 family metalloprotease [Carboxylicivirga sp. M1479]|uniref:M48 family metalloprotease n=1 Tax=Carboxylicivirga sp. M1479 TaxID=2594476 RepID=UPI001178612B|nr:M48 family metalloprotease [Carboxylicivirga sp. M1479]TRX70650.1 M48 family metalloprotease [Carboxylicivirga sp. M1479]
MKINIIYALAFCCTIFNTNAQSIEIDKRLGKESAKAVELEMGIYNNEKLSEYVSSLGQRLVSHLDKPLFDYEFHVVDDPIPNAFATPGGYIYVTRGILSIIASEDELACVMAHEIIHAQNRHSVKQMGKSILPKLLELPGRVVGQVVNDDIGRILNAPITTSNSLLLASYSRSHETESDVEGVILASKAGYDPDAMKSILVRLSKSMEILTNQKEVKGYFNSHPYTPDRLEKITKTTAKLDWETKTKVSKDFPQPLDSLLFGANPDKGFFQENTFIHPAMNFSFQFPNDWHTENKPTSVNGMNKDKSAALFLGLDDVSKTPKELAHEFISGVKKEHRAKPAFSDHYKINNNDGYLVSYLDDSENKQMYIHTLWLKMDGKMFKIIGIAPKSKEDELKKSVLSFHPLTDKEKSIVKNRYIRVVESKGGETFDQICKHHNCILSPDLTAFINGMDSTSSLKDGTLIKIIIEEDYFN